LALSVETFSLKNRMTENKTPLLQLY